MVSSIKMFKEALGAESFVMAVEEALDGVSPHDRRRIEEAIAKFRSFGIERDTATELLAAIGIEIMRADQRKMLSTTGVNLSESILS